MPRPPQPVLLPWLQPGGVEPLFQPPPCPLPCLAKAGAVRPTPITTLASSAVAAMPLAIAVPPGDHLSVAKHSGSLGCSARRAGRLRRYRGLAATNSALGTYNVARRSRTALIGARAVDGAGLSPE